MANIIQKYGGLKIIWHPRKLEAIRDRKITAPICVRLKIENHCNHHCFYCSYDPEAESKNVLSFGFKRNDRIPKEKILEILDDFKDIGTKAITFSLDKNEIIPIEIDGFLKLVKIGDLVKNFNNSREIISWTLNDEFKKDKIKEVLHHKSDGTMYKITLESGKNITVTGNHSLYFFENNQIICEEVQKAVIGDKLVFSNIYLPNKEEFIIDTSLFNNHTRKGRGIKNPNKFVVDKDFCRLLGYYIAEGFISDDKYQLNFYFGKYLGQEKKYIDDVINILNKYGFEKNLKVYKYSNKTQIILFSKWFNEMIESLNCGKLARNKRVPDLIFNLNDDYKKEFLRGLFAGDGNFRNTLTKKKQKYFNRNVLCLKTSSKILTQTLSFLLDGLNIFATIIEGINGIRFFGKRKLPQTNYFSISINRKNDLEKLDEIIKFLGNKPKYRLSKYSNYAPKIKKEFINKDAYALKIKKIEKINFNGEVYDISIKNSSRFITSFGILAHNSGGGEPLLHPSIIEVLKRAIKNKIELSIITNGQLLNGERAKLLKDAKWVRISLDACDRETFSKIRRVPEELFDALIQNIKDFAKIKSKSCEFGINFVVNHLNYKKVYEAAKFFKSLGLNHVKFTPRWIDTKGEWIKYHEPFKENVIKQIKRAEKELVDKNFAIFDTYENDFKLTGVPMRTYSKCSIMQIVPVIGADSVVYYCHDKTYLKNGALGSIKNKSFKDLWFSKETAKKFKKFNPMKECQQHCTYDSRNILIKDIINSYSKDHINFP